MRVRGLRCIAINWGLGSCCFCEFSAFEGKNFEVEETGEHENWDVNPEPQNPKSLNPKNPKP